MGYVVTLYWSWLLACTVVGLAMGWISVVNRGNGMSRVDLQRAGIVIAALVFISLLRLLPGRAGYWLDLALVMLVFYVAGCLLGSALRHTVLSRSVPPPA